MVRQALRKGNRGQQATPMQISAPIKGWVTARELADMPKGTAVILENFFPEADTVRLRGGSPSFVTGLGPNPVETLMTYRAAGVERMFAACGRKIFEVTTGTAVEISIGGFQSARWNWTNFVTSGGVFLIACNGVDAPICFDGSAWSIPSYTGVLAKDGTSAALAYPVSYRERLFFLSKNSSTLYYLPADSFQGSLSTFECGGDLRLGGALLVANRWTYNAATGPGDYLILVSNKGELLMFQGINPSDATNWALTGTFYVAPPLGDRSLLRIGGDLAILCEDGVLPMSQAITIDPGMDRESSFSANIHNVFTQTVAQYGKGFGWQIHSHPRKNMAIVNVPLLSNGGAAQQFVMNILTKAWCKFTGMNALCWGNMGDNLYFGAANGSIFQADSGKGDNGQKTRYSLVTAFEEPGGRGLIKQSTLLRAIWQATPEISISLGVCTDYQPQLPSSTPANPPSGSALWDQAVWDQDVWGDDLTNGVPRQTWVSAPGVGHAFAAAAYCEVDNSLPAVSTVARLAGFDLLLERGEAL